jgi:hypothetical protein
MGALSSKAVGNCETDPSTVRGIGARVGVFEVDLKPYGTVSREFKAKRIIDMRRQ